jgi:hypothetical protein
MDPLGSSLRRPRATLELAPEILTDVSAGGGKILPWTTGAPGREPCASHRKARSSMSVPARWIHGKPAVRGRLRCATDAKLLLPGFAMNRRSKPETTIPDTVQTDTVQLFYRARGRALRGLEWSRSQKSGSLSAQGDSPVGHSQAGGPPRFRKLPNVGTGQLLPLMEDLSHVPICPMNCERSVA